MKNKAWIIKKVLCLWNHANYEQFRQMLNNIGNKLLNYVKYKIDSKLSTVFWDFIQVLSSEENYKLKTKNFFLYTYLTIHYIVT